jgi:hypothetical protein
MTKKLGTDPFKLQTARVWKKKKKKKERKKEKKEKKKNHHKWSILAATAVTHVWLIACLWRWKSTNSLKGKKHTEGLLIQLKCSKGRPEVREQEALGSQ